MRPKVEDRPPAPARMCATPGCPYDAAVRVRRREVRPVPGRLAPDHVLVGAWIDLCHSCDDARRRSGNVEYVKAMGLETPAKQRAWCLDQLKRDILNREPARMREPGEDDE